MPSLPPSIPTSWARLSSRLSLPWSRPPRIHSARCFHQGPRDTVQRYTSPNEYSFERLRLQPAVLAALRLAFPSIKQPTPIQYRFIDDVLKGKDVLLKDKTGSGKSFALALALLSQKRGPVYKGDRTNAQSMPITALLLVPHRDLAFQFFHWIERIHHHMACPMPLPSLAQVLIRDSTATLEEHLAPIQRSPPQILIGTPQAVLDIVQADPNALPLDRLSTVVVDEVDYLIESVPKISDKHAMMKAERRINRHPGPTRLLLDHIYSTANMHRKDTHQTTRGQNSVGYDHRRDDSARARPQLVMMSATLRNHLKRFLLADSGWFTKESRMLVRITGQVSAHQAQDTKGQFLEDQAADSIGGTDIHHHVLLVSERGGITNVEGALDAPVASSEESNVSREPSEASNETRPASELSQVPAVDEDIDDGPSPFDPNAMEAVGAAFALDVPSVALLVLPSDAPVQRAVHDLRLMGVNAHPLDVVKDENGRTHLMRRNFDSTAENPTLLVSTLASTRGLDLPELSHVFILGILDDGAVDSYLHVAGRVGRFGRGGKVISVLAERHEVIEGNGKRRTRDEPRMMGTMLKKMGIRAVKLEHFD